MNNVKEKIKLFKRFLKDKGILTVFEKWARTYKTTSPNPKKYNTLSEYLMNGFSSTSHIYSQFTGHAQGEYINDYNVYLTETLTIPKSLELFKNFLIENYGEETYNNYLKNISINFIDVQTRHYQTIPNEKGIKKLPINSYLFYAFEWEATPQRHDFWMIINDRWISIYESLIIKTIYNNNDK